MVGWERSGNMRGILKVPGRRNPTGIPAERGSTRDERRELEATGNQAECVENQVSHNKAMGESEWRERTPETFGNRTREETNKKQNKCSRK